MPFATRAFLWSFLPVAALLAGSFWVLRGASIAAVRDGLRTSVRESQESLVKERARARRRNRQLLGVVAENAALKAGVQLVLMERAAPDAARHTLEDQLYGIAAPLDLDFLMVSGTGGDLLAGVQRSKAGFAPVSEDVRNAPEDGLLATAGRVYQVTSVPIYLGVELSGTLTLGESFDLSDFVTPVVLYRQGAVTAANLRLHPEEVAAALANCPPNAECEAIIGGQAYLSLPMTQSLALPMTQGLDDGGYRLRSLQSVDEAAGPVQSVLRRVFAVSGGLSMVAALGISAFSSRSMVRPLADLVARLHMSGKTGVLPELPSSKRGPLEIRELIESFGKASRAVREGQERLSQAHLGFIEALASALDARDLYTAGHSRRVSVYSCAIARVMRVPEDQIEEIRVGALLHDVGKIGISDAILRKPGRLTPEENALIQQHPVIGRRILEQVVGFEPYLGVVELHHENWDGKGYPRGLREEETPLAARIVKVADAYDAMTSDRPYRLGSSHEEAVRILEENAGTQLDPHVVRVFAAMGCPERPADQPIPTAAELHHLAEAIAGGAAAVPDRESV